MFLLLALLACAGPVELDQAAPPPNPWPTQNILDHPEADEPVNGHQSDQAAKDDVAKQKAKGAKQKAKGAKQKAKGAKQKTKGAKQKAKGTPAIPRSGAAR